MKIKAICRHEIVYKNGKSPLAIRFTRRSARPLQENLQAVFLCDCIKNAVVFSYPQGWRTLKNKPQMPKNNYLQAQRAANVTAQIFRSKTTRTLPEKCRKS